MEFDYSLLIKYYSNSLTIEEKMKLEEWRMLSEENQRTFSVISKLRLVSEYKSRDVISDTNPALIKFRNNINHIIIRHRFLNVLKYTAVVAVIVLTSVFGWKFINDERYTIITAANDYVKKVELIDGSTVWLDSSAELHIPKSFSSTNRTLSLKGHAFFKVEKNEDSPFIVKTPYVTLEVLGTSFDLMIDDERQRVETILATGKVMLKKNDKNIRSSQLEIMPGEKVVYNAIDDIYIVSEVDVNTVTSWYLDQMIFENATLQEIVDKLSVIYNVEIFLESDTLKNRRYRYIINKEEELNEVLKMLSYVAPLHYRIEGDKVFITDKYK